MAADAVLIDALHRVGLGPRRLGTGRPRAGLLLAGKVVPLEAAREGHRFGTCWTSSDPGTGRPSISSSEVYSFMALGISKAAYPAPSTS